MTFFFSIYIITTTMKKYILFLIFLFFLLLSLEMDLLSFHIGGFSQKLSMSELVIFLFILFVFLNIKRIILNEFANNYKSLILLTILFLLSGFLSALFSPVDKFFALKNFFRYFLFLTTPWFFLYLLKRHNLSNDFLLILFYLSVFLSFIAIFEAYNNIFAKFLADTFREGQSVYINNKLRPAATLSHSNIFACFMSISVIIAIKLYFEKKLNSFIFFTGITFLLIGLSLSSSRNALFSFSISILILFFNKKYFKVVSVVGLIFILSYIIFSPSVNRISEIKTQSTASRVLLVETSLKMFPNYPLLGVGPGCFNKLLYKYSPKKLLQIENLNIKNETLHAHNGFLNILTEFGLFGFTLFLVFFFFYLKFFFKQNPIPPISINHSLFLVISLPFLPDAFFIVIFTWSYFL